MTSTTAGRPDASAFLTAAPISAGSSTRIPTRAHALGELGEVHLAEVPHLLPLVRWLAVIGGGEDAVLLIERIVVVDDRDRRDVAAYRGLELLQVIPETAIAGEADDRPLRHGAFRADRRREAPAERAGAADEIPVLAVDPQLLRDPHRRVAGIADDEGIVRQRPRRAPSSAVRDEPDAGPNCAAS